MLIRIYEHGDEMHSQWHQNRLGFKFPHIEYIYIRIYIMKYLILCRAVHISYNIPLSLLANSWMDGLTIATMTIPSELLEFYICANVPYQTPYLFTIINPIICICGSEYRLYVACKCFISSSSDFVQRHVKYLKSGGGRCVHIVYAMCVNLQLPFP